MDYSLLTHSRIVSPAALSYAMTASNNTLLTLGIPRDWSGTRPENEPFLSSLLSHPLEGQQFKDFDHTELNGLGTFDTRYAQKFLLEHGFGRRRTFRQLTSQERADLAPLILEDGQIGLPDRFANLGLCKLAPSWPEARIDYLREDGYRLPALQLPASRYRVGTLGNSTVYRIPAANGDLVFVRRWVGNTPPVEICNPLLLAELGQQLTRASVMALGPTPLRLPLVACFDTVTLDPLIGLRTGRTSITHAYQRVALSWDEHAAKTTPLADSSLDPLADEPMVITPPFLMAIVRPSFNQGNTPLVVAWIDTDCCRDPQGRPLTTFQRKSLE